MDSVENQIPPSVNAMHMIILIYDQEADYKRLFVTATGLGIVDDASL